METHELLNTIFAGMTLFGIFVIALLGFLVKLIAGILKKINSIEINMVKEETARMIARDEANIAVIAHAIHCNKNTKER